MPITSDMTWSGQANVEDKFLISFSDGSAINTFVGREGVDEIPHANGNPDDHPTLNKVKRAGSNYILSKGIITVYADWEGDTDPPSSDDVDAYISHLQSRNFSQPAKNVVKTDTRLEFDFTADKEITGGPYEMFDWNIKSSRAGIIIKDPDTYLACILRLGDNPFDWTFSDYIVKAGETLSISKQGTECYLFICGPSFIIGDTILQDKSVKKLTSSNASIQNNGSKTAKIGMLYK